MNECWWIVFHIQSFPHGVTEGFSLSILEEMAMNEYFHESYQ